MKDELCAEIQKYISETHKDMLVTGLDADGTLHIDTYGECVSCPYNCLSAESGLAKELQAQYPAIRRVSVTPAISDETMSLAKKLLGIMP